MIQKATCPHEATQSPAWGCSRPAVLWKFYVFVFPNFEMVFARKFMVDFHREDVLR